MHLFDKILVGLLLFVLPCCNTDNLEDLNIDPTISQTLDWKFLLTHGQHQLFDNASQAHVIYLAPLVQHLATLSSRRVSAGDKYFRNSTAFDQPFGAYLGALKTFGEVIRQTDPEGSNSELHNLHHIAQVCYILKMHTITDLYGNVPYSEANQGVGGILFAKYDHQELIYKDMLVKLETAALEIGLGTDEIGSADLIYRGDLLKWRRLANSLMLRLAMRISDADPNTAEIYVKKAIEGGTMKSNEDLAFIPTEKGLHNNPIGTYFDPLRSLSESMMSKTMIDYLKKHNDPRLLIYTSGIGSYSEPKNNVYEAQQGLPNGFDQVSIKTFLGVDSAIDRTQVFSSLHEDLTDLDDPYLLMTYAEVELLLTEASMKGWNPEDAQVHYNAAVQGAMQQWSLFGNFSISQSQIDEYLVANPFDGSMQMLGEQHWVSSFLIWAETYSNWRRIGFPSLIPVDYPGNISDGEIFRRFEYSTAEVATNPNLETGGTAPNHVLTRVWWDVK